MGKKYYYVRGNHECPKKVIAVLKKYGGRNYNHCDGKDEEMLYFINKHNIISCMHKDCVFKDLLIDSGEELFPEPDDKPKTSYKKICRICRYWIDDEGAPFCIVKEHRTHTRQTHKCDCYNERGELYFKSKTN